MPFPYKTVLITGATAGIGRALAERMISNGIFVIAVGRRSDRLQDLLTKHGSGKVAIETFDISELDELPAWVAGWAFLTIIIKSYADHLAELQQGIHNFPV